MRAQTAWSLLWLDVPILPCKLAFGLEAFTVRTQPFPPEENKINSRHDGQMHEIMSHMNMHVYL